METIGVIDRQGCLGRTIRRIWPKARMEISASGALGLLRQGAVDVVFLRIGDLNSWEGDIFHCLVQSRRQGRCVLVVAPEDMATGVYGRSKGCADFIVTPVTKESVQRASEKVRALNAPETKHLLEEECRVKAPANEQSNLERVQRFLVEIRHEINTSLHGILNFARFGIKEMTRTRHRPEQNRVLEYFREIESAGTHLMRVARQLEEGLSGRSRRGKTCFVRERFSTVMRAAIQEVEEAHPYERIQKVFRRPGADDFTEMDVGKIKQVIQNLILGVIQDNAARRKIIVTTDVEEEMVWFSVGIASQQVSRLEAVFRRGSLGSGGVFGQGRMTVLRDIVRAHQGQIWFGPTRDNPEALVRFFITRRPMDAFASAR